ncbi:MAG: formate dehydrogenase, partial [Chloroflexota bacterium]
TLNAFLKSLLESHLLDALLVAVELPTGHSVTAALVRHQERLGGAAPLAPVMPVSTARVVSQLTRNAPSKKRVGVVLRSCELRALLELVKLKQASLENLVLIGMDCPGTYSVAGYDELCRQTATPVEDFLKGRSPDLQIREACRVCEYPAPPNADLVLGLIGLDVEKEILVQATSPEGQRLLEALKLPPATEEEKRKRETALSELVAERIKARDELFSQAQVEAGGLGNLLAMLSACVNCHNCRVACPLCYCRECFFDSATFEWEAEKYLGWAGKKGALRMPTDTLLFHLTRLNHMVMSCVG